MSRMTSIEEEEKLAKFAFDAATHFTAHPDHASYGATDGRREARGAEELPYLALRWGLGNDCVLVLKLDEYWEPINFQQAIRKGLEIT